MSEADVGVLEVRNSERVPFRQRGCPGGCCDLPGVVEEDKHALAGFEASLGGHVGADGVDGLHKCMYVRTYGADGVDGLCSAAPPWHAGAQCRIAASAPAAESVTI